MTQLSTFDLAANAILAGIRSRIGEESWLALSDAQRGLVVACSRDAAGLLIGAVAGEDLAKLAGERRHIEAQLASFASANESRVVDALWAAAKGIAQRTITVVL